MLLSKSWLFKHSTPVCTTVGTLHTFELLVLPSSLASKAGCRKAVVEGDGLAKLVSFLGNKEYADLHVLGVSVLSLCLEDAESMVALQGSGCLQQLLQHITESNSADMKRHAAKALATAATNCESYLCHLIQLQSNCIVLSCQSEDSS